MLRICCFKTITFQYQASQKVAEFSFFSDHTLLILSKWVHNFKLLVSKFYRKLLSFVRFRKINGWKILHLVVCRAFCQNPNYGAFLISQKPKIKMRENLPQWYHYYNKYQRQGSLWSFIAILFLELGLNATVWPKVGIWPIFIDQLRQAISRRYSRCQIL